MSWGSAQQSNADRFGGAALITGASSGFGVDFARQLAASGMDVILVARREELLQELATEIRQAHGVQALVCPQDLTSADAAAAIEQRVSAAGMHVGLLINNAGFGSYGAFEATEPDFEERMVDLNCRAVVALTRRFVPGMLQRGTGGIIVVASMAAYQPVPYLTTYGATKAFALSFSEALWAELQGTGVAVLALCPGYVDTGFQTVAGSASMAKVGRVLTSEQVVTTALSAIGRKPSVVPGLVNKFFAFSTRLFPRALTALTTAKMMKPET